MKELVQILPFASSNNYYLYDCVGGNLFSCTEIIYLICVNYKSTELLRKKEIISVQKIESNTAFNKFSKNEIIEGLNLANKLIIDIEKSWKQLKHNNYLTIKRENVIKSLALVKHITLEITNECNLDCVYCCYGKIYKNIQRKSSVKSENIISYINTLLNLKTYYNIGFENLIVSFYGGEPLLRFDIIEHIVNLVKDKAKGNNITFSMTTNGVLLHKYMDFLVEHNFKLLISLDGNEIQDSYRALHNGKNSFKIVEENVLSIYNKYQEYFKQNIDFSTVLHDKNECISVCDYFDKFNKIPSFSNLAEEGVKPSQRKLFNLLNKRHSYTDEEVKNIAISHPIVYNELFTNNELEDLLFNHEGHTPESFTEIFNQQTMYPDDSCFLFQNRAFIDVNGYLYLCEKSNRKFRFGRIAKDKITIYTKQINRFYENINSIHSEKCAKYCYTYCRCKECYFSDSEIVQKGLCKCDAEKMKGYLHNAISKEERRVYE